MPYENAPGIFAALQPGHAASNAGVLPGGLRDPPTQPIAVQDASAIPHRRERVRDEFPRHERYAHENSFSLLLGPSAVIKFISRGDVESPAEMSAT